MSWHRDKRVDQAFLALMDALVSWERDTGRGSRLIFIPDWSDETTILLVDGKPVPHGHSVIISQLEILISTIKGRR